MQAAQLHGADGAEAGGAACAHASSFGAGGFGAGGVGAGGSGNGGAGVDDSSADGSGADGSGADGSGADGSGADGSKKGGLGAGGELFLFNAGSDGSSSSLLESRSPFRGLTGGAPSSLSLLSSQNGRFLAMLESVNLPATLATAVAEDASARLRGLWQAVHFRALRARSSEAVCRLRLP